MVNPPFQEVYRGIAASLEKLGLGSFLIPWGRFDVHSLEETLPLISHWPHTQAWLVIGSVQFESPKFVGIGIEY